VVRGRRRGLIAIYGNPDPDALGSAWALKTIFRRWGVPAAVAYTGEVGRLENQAMIEYLRIPAGRFDPAAAGRADLVAVVDAQPSFFPAGQLPRSDIVFDHHPIRRVVRAPFADVRPKCLATSSILTDYLLAAGCRLNRRLATALFYGIMADAQQLYRARTAIDAAALEALENRVDRTLLRRIECSAYSLSRLDYFAIAAIRLRHHRGMLYAHLGPVPSGDLCGQIADFLIRVKEAKWALVSGVAGDTLVVVFRCDGQYGNAGRTAHAAFGRLGSAGGHETMGRAEIPGANLPRGMLLTHSERIERFVLERLAAVRRGFRPVLDAVLVRSD
jgi:nanoRNase/pAp phosphatase (c-di-AMP/oligoRNAs hydrolase)